MSPSISECFKKLFITLATTNVPLITANLDKIPTNQAYFRTPQFGDIEHTIIYNTSYKKYNRASLVKSVVALGKTVPTTRT